MASSKSIKSADIPRGTPDGFAKHWRQDILSGFLVFLIALPLCLGIALACGYPPIAGVFTAIIGGVVSPFISNSELTIKGPAAGLIVIAIGCVQDFGGNGAIDGSWTSADQHAYALALGVGVAAAAIQIIFAAFRGGKLGEFFPSSAVHGMLAAIGIIIIAKQIPVTLGVSAKGGPLELIAKIPETIAYTNPIIGLIGIMSLVIMFCWPLLNIKYLSKIPAPVVVLLVSVPLGLYFDLNSPDTHSYVFRGTEYFLSEKFLVNVPDNMFAAMTFPDFSGLGQLKAWKWVFMFSIIGTLESLLSAKAIDMIDPWKRSTDLDRDNMAVGIGNSLAAFVGGLPMISEIVRSRANIDNDARTRFANTAHGLFLFLFVLAVPGFIHLIPLAALGAMLVYTGFRLTHPREFIHVYQLGFEQLIVFVSTIIAVLATDLLIGIAIGIGVKIVLHLMHGVPVKSLFRAEIVKHRYGSEKISLQIMCSAVFTNWLALRRQIEQAAAGAKELELDFSNARLVDHTVMEKLHELKRAIEQQDVRLEFVGFHDHEARANHPLAARKKVQV